MMRSGSLAFTLAEPEKPRLFWWDFPKEMQEVSESGESAPVRRGLQEKAEKGTSLPVLMGLHT